MTQHIIALIAVTVFIFGSGGYFAYQNQLLTNENSDLQSKITTKETDTARLQDEKSIIEQEVAAWKAIDLEKESELLRLKLKNAEKNLAAEEKKSAKLRMNMNKMKPYRDALAAVDRFFSGPMTNANLNTIDVAIDALHDGLITNQWMQAKADINVSQNSWGTNGIVHTLFLIVSKIRGFAS